MTDHFINSFSLPPPSLRTELLSKLKVDYFTDELFLSSEFIDRYTSDSAIELLISLGIDDYLRSSSSAKSLDSIINALNFNHSFLPGLNWLLERLVHDQCLKINRSENIYTYQPTNQLPAPAPTSNIRQLGRFSIHCDTAVAAI